MPKWTTDQRAAIETGGGPILVSAAAGSGKTAVLVERVLRRLTDPAHPVDLDRFLLVTFTNAAAAEMRFKLADALAARLAADPGNARLRRQMLLLDKADITTVHAFCMKLAREHADALGVPPDFRLLDESEGRQLRAQTLEAVLDARYEAGDSDFLALSDLLTAGQSDGKLAETVLETFEKVGAHADPDGFLDFLRARLFDNPPPAESAVGRLLLACAEESAGHGLGLLNRAIALLEEADDELSAYLPALTHDRESAHALLAAIRAGDWDGAVECAASVAFDRLPVVRGYADPDFQERIKSLRQTWKDMVALIRKNYLSVTAEQAAYDQGLTGPALAALLDLTRDFGAEYSREKLARHAADFSDLEHFAVRLLLQDGAPTELARRLSARFDEVLVDEYQDTNGVQDAIFGALSAGERKLFMVGDVKQSIYRFRLADPQIFLDRYRRYPDEQVDGGARRIVLSRNFRSRVPVIEATNYIFSRVMSERVGELAYTAREALVPGADYENPDDPRYAAEVLLLDTAVPKGEEKPDKSACEARMIAARIRALLDEGLPVYDKALDATRPVTPADIVILLRSPRRRATALRAALAAYGVPVRTEESTGLLATAEVGTIVSLLAVIDNPRQDVELIGVLRSPLFGFTEERLGEIRLKEKSVSFYDAFCACAETDADCAAFLETLRDLRLLACDLPVYRLLWEIYTRTSALGLFAALPGGAQRRQNLLAFLERARAFEQSGARGLFRFVALLRSMLANGDDFEIVRAQGGEGAVRILSIHKSKGLEYPVVLLADCAGRFNRSDLTDPVLIHPKLGVAAKCRDLARGVQYNTLERQAFAVALGRESLSEELRVLYVAMTRAREKLILTAVSENMAARLEKYADMARSQPLSPYEMGRAPDFLQWILAPLIRHPAAEALRACAPDLTPDPDAPAGIRFALHRPEDFAQAEAAPAEHAQADGLPAVPGPLDYPGAALADLPAKLTATGMKEDFKSVEAAEETRPPRPKPALRRPDFDRARTGLTPAEQGTAHHLFLQFCDFDACARGEVEAEIARLREKRILAPEQADAVRPARIARFFASDLYRAFAGARVRREFKFSVVVPARDYYPEVDDPEETVLLQGVVDCLLETAEGFTVIDFKTDRVRPESAPLRARDYAPQLAAYAAAVARIFDRPVVAKKLFFLETGQTIDC